MATTLEQALSAAALGVCVVPVRGDGTKRPALDAWRQFQSGPADESIVRAWFADRPGSDGTLSPPKLGLGAVCGATSGGGPGRWLIIIDVEGKGGARERFLSAVEAERPGLLQRLPLVLTPGGDGGLHVWVRSPVELRNEKLARGKDGATLVETKGEGGFVIMPGGHPSAHPSGKPYLWMDGHGIELIDSEVTTEDVDALLHVARSMDARPEGAKEERSWEPRSPTDPIRPGDEFNARANWKEIMLAHGYRLTDDEDGVQRWRQPQSEKTRGGCATTGHCRRPDGVPLLHVFCGHCAPFEAGKTYTPFHAYVLLNHGGDWGAAARAISDKGYRPTARDAFSWESGLKAALERVRDSVEGKGEEFEARGKVATAIENVPELGTLIEGRRSEWNAEEPILRLIAYRVAGIYWARRLKLSDEETVSVIFMAVKAAGVSPVAYLKRVWDDLGFIAEECVWVEKNAREGFMREADVVRARLQMVEAGEARSSTPKGDGVDEGAKKQSDAINLINQRLGLLNGPKLVRFLLDQTADPATHYVEFDDGETIPIGDIDDVLSPRGFERALALHRSHVIPMETTKAGMWRRVAALLLKIRVLESPRTPTLAAGEEIDAYLKRNPAQVCDSDEARLVAAESGKPHVWGGALWVSHPDVSRWASCYDIEAAKGRKTIQVLRQSGFTHEQVRIGRNARSFWRRSV